MAGRRRPGQPTANWPTEGELASRQRPGQPKANSPTDSELANSAVAGTVLEAESIAYHYANAVIPAWNVLARFAVLWMFSALVSHLSARLAEETGLSRTDALTGLPNARAFREAADEEIDRMRTSGGVLTAAYVDVAGFKAVNDTLGHAAGGAVLTAAGRVLGSEPPSGSRVARLGGDEFAVLLPRTALDEALTLLGTLRDDLLNATGAWSPEVGSASAPAPSRPHLPRPATCWNRRTRSCTAPSATVATRSGVSTPTRTPARQQPDRPGSLLRTLIGPGRRLGDQASSSDSVRSARSARANCAGRSTGPR
jgi:diguanylate cyclase (GGDEF)-like protein